MGENDPRTSPGGSEVVVAETSVASVTFFEDRAEVVRTLRCHVAAGRTRVIAKGITLLIDDRSLMCKAPPETGVNIVYSRVRRRVEDVQEGSAEQIAALESEIDELRARLQGLERALGRSSADGRRTIALLDQWASSLSTVPSRGSAARSELTKAYDEIDRVTIAMLDTYAEIRSQKEDVNTSLAQAAARLEQARARKPRFEAFAEIEIVAKDETELTIELVYRTPCALWRPEHVARLVRDSKDHATGTISITTYASVWQFTGETWTDVPCRFSTARPARSASAPHLREDVLATRKKTDQERKQIVVEAREQAITTAGTSRGTRDVDEMPGVEDGGEAQWLTGRSPATIVSDGRPVRVEVGERSFPCTIARVAFPEIGPATHLRANATLPGPRPLLAGPVTIGRETEIVGKSLVKFVGPGEPFELGFGVDDGLRVRRRVSERRKTTPVTGTQHVERKVQLFVSNLSDKAKTLSLVERVPVSEVEDVRIEIDQQREGQTPSRHDARDGFVTFDLDVVARGTKELTLVYRVEAKSNVVLPSFD